MGFKKIFSDGKKNKIQKKKITISIQNMQFKVVIDIIYATKKICQ
jgi:hypothetical protein